MTSVNANNVYALLSNLLQEPLSICLDLVSVSPKRIGIDVWVMVISELMTDLRTSQSFKLYFS